jgi:predicted RNase H-like nuclease (RuvC/YqgF family)
MSQKTTYYHPEGSVSFEKTLIVTGTNLEVRVQQLERENATLREKDEDWENAVLHARDHRCDEAHCTCVVPLLGKINQLERENAALQAALDQQANYQRELRADRDRLDWLEVGCSCDLSWVGKEAPPSALTSLRKAIDWAMEEEQS